MKQTQKKFQGSFFNCLMANNETIPVVGEYVTEIQYYDRKVHRVKAINGKKVTIQYCKQKFTGKVIGEQYWEIVPTDFTFDVIHRYGGWYRINNEFEKPQYIKIRLAFNVCDPYYHWEF